MIELCNYIYNNYPNLNKQIPRWKLLSLLDRYSHRVIQVKEGDKFLGAALYIKVNDETLLKIANKELDISNPEDMRICLNSEGDNVHFLIVLADGVRTILKGLKEVIEREHPNTVSWYKPDMLNFKIFKTKGSILCLQ